MLQRKSETGRIVSEEDALAKHRLDLVEVPTDGGGGEVKACGRSTMNSTLGIAFLMLPRWDWAERSSSPRKTADMWRGDALMSYMHDRGPNLAKARAP